MENNPEIALAWQFIENTGTHLFLTGKAGTGKTTFLRKLRAESPKRMIVLAPTGIAAINAFGGCRLEAVPRPEQTLWRRATADDWRLTAAVSRSERR